MIGCDSISPQGFACFTRQRLPVWAGSLVLKPKQPTYTLRSYLKGQEVHFCDLLLISFFAD